MRSNCCIDYVTCIKSTYRQGFRLWIQKAPQTIGALSTVNTNLRLGLGDTLTLCILRRSSLYKPRLYADTIHVHLLKGKFILFNNIALHKLYRNLCFQFQITFERLLKNRQIIVKLTAYVDKWIQIHLNWLQNHMVVLFYFMLLQMIILQNSWSIMLS